MGTLPGAWELLTLRRAPANPYDGNAVEGWWSAGPWMLGHIFREDAEHLALMGGALHESDQIVRDARTKIELIPQVGTVSSATA
ncbi:hypothetical protein CRT60_22120 [Azospirillum palustre]|uniref:Uncharacterized protein n=1 Tax=Azospirillum palustre TaxID=2044885 RepID=A0A2B8BEH2_9PROT|nr:hypothetical protein CRT60_22120 [Azospirillum palustre]